MLMLNGEVLEMPRQDEDAIERCTQAAVNWLLDKVGKGWPVEGKDFDELRERVGMAARRTEWQH